MARLKKPEEKLEDETAVKQKLKESLDKSVKGLSKGLEKLPIAFSGGLDSSILAYLAAKYSRTLLFCVGFKDSHDIKNAGRSAKLLGQKLEIVLLDNIDLKKYKNKTQEIIETDDKLQTELALPLLVLGEKVRDLGFKYLVTGQSADTLFGGFDKYLRSKDLEGDIFTAVRNMGETNLKRDLAIGKYCGLEMLFPFLDDEMVKFALKVPISYKIKDGVKKYILREAFRGILPDEIIDQNKKAFQYGSGVHKALNKQ